MYNAYIEKVLAPVLRPGDIVIADNLNVHKSEISKRLIENADGFYEGFTQVMVLDVEALRPLHQTFSSPNRKAATDATLREFKN